MKRMLKRIESHEAALKYFDAEGNMTRSGNLTGNVSWLLRGNVSWLLTGDVSGLTGDVSGLRGNVSGLTGNVRGLRGNMRGLRGDVSGLRGNVEECEISQRDREKGICVDTLVDKDEPVRSSKEAI